jgi:cytochrome c2
LPTAHALIPLILLVGACKPPPDERNEMPEASPAQGLAVIKRVGCASCHTIPGLPWPEGQVGPNLHRFAERNLISGQLPNRPDVLTAYVRNAPAILPGTTMPAMPISQGEARDVAAYLYTLRGS